MPLRRQAAGPVPRRRLRAAPLVGRLTLLALVLLPATRARGAASLFDAEVAARRAEAAALAGKPEAIAPLLGVLELWSDVEDRQAIAALLDAVREDARQLPDVRARATFLRSIVANRLGDEEGAARLRAAIGLVTDFQVLGPFDNEGRSADARALPPERDLALPLDGKARYPGSLASDANPSVGWRRLVPGRAQDGVVALDAAMQPEQHVVGYATTFVRVDRELDAAVRVGSTGAVRVWVGDHPALQDDSYRPLRLDQDAAPLHLRAGWNRLTVKLGADEGGWSFLLRLTAPDGGPLAFEATADPARVTLPRLPARPAIKGAAPAAVSDLHKQLKAAADTGALAAQRALGLYLHYVSPEDPRLGGAERVLAFAASLSGDVTGYRLAALAAADDDKARKLLEEAVAPGRKGERAERARALTELGRIYERLHRERRAEELWRAALAEEPDFFPATLALAELAASRGLPSRARAMLDEAGRSHQALSVLRAQAQLAERQGRQADAEALYRRIADATRDDLTALRQLGRFARLRGDVDAAARLLARMATVRPDLGSLVAERAQLLDGVGRGEEAHAVLTAALAASPDQADLLELDGRVLHRLGRDGEALGAFRRSLELRPQAPELRTYAAALQAQAHKGDAAGSGEDLAREWAVPVDDLVARAARAPRPEREATWVLLDRDVVRVLPNGLTQTFSQSVFQVLDERGAREQGQVVLRYTPDSQSLEVKVARVYKASGEIIEAASRSDQETSEPWYGLYYDTRALVIELPRLEPGDVVEVQSVVSDVASRNMFGDYFGDLHLLQGDAPRMESDYIVVAPTSRRLYFNKPELAGARALTSDERVSGAARVFRFHAEGVPRIQSEPGMPGITSLGGYVHVSTFQGWEEVAEWYRGLVRDQLQPDDAIKDAVKEALKALGERARTAGRSGGVRPVDERARIGAIYDLVVKSTRYVGLEFGIHGYKPYRVSQIFQRKFGDCKDKASLLVAMLKLAGVDASLVLVRTRRGGDIGAYPASLAPFDHAIAWVPKYDLFLDGTAEFSGSGELPAQDQDVPVLIISDPRTGGRGHFVRTPVLPPERNRARRTSTVALTAGGDAKVTLDLEVEGQAASQFRSHYQSPGERRERFEKSENGNHPGARVDKVDFPTIEELEQPVRALAEMEVPAWARPVPGQGGGAALAMPALGHEGEMLSTYARLSERRRDLVLGYPWQQEERLAITLPPGFAVTRMPAARTVESPFGRFVFSAERAGAEVKVAGHLTVRRNRIGAAEYPAFRRFCLDVDRVLAQELVIAHE